MGIAFWADKDTDGLKLLELDQFLRLIKKEDAAEEIGLRKGLNIIVEGLVKNPYRASSYLNLYSEDYAKLTDITDTIPLQEDTYSRISQILKGEKKKLEYKIIFPPDGRKMICGCVSPFASIEPISYKIGPFEKGDQVFRLYLHVEKSPQFEKKEGISYSCYSTIGYISCQESEWFSRRRDDFEKYFDDNIKDTIMIPDIHRITLILPNKDIDRNGLKKIWGEREQKQTSLDFFGYYERESILDNADNIYIDKKTGLSYATFIERNGEGLKNLEVRHSLISLYSS